MKVILTFTLLICITFTGYSQTGITYRQWQHPILQQLRAGSTNLLPFYNKDSTAFITISIIDKKEKSIYWFDCYGYYFDAVPITDNNIEAIATKRVTAFAYYDLISTAYLKTINKARSNFQANGSSAKFTPYENQLLQIDDSIKFPSTLKKLIELDKQKLSVERQLREFHSISPAKIKEDTVFSKTLALQYGSMQKSYQEDTTTTYYNRVALEPVYKAVVNNTTASIMYYNRANQLIDEIPLEKDKMYSLLNEKADVFLLYRGWLELQRFNIIGNISDLKKAKNEFTSTGNSFNSALSYANQLLKVTDYKIDYLTTIDRGFVSQLLKNQYRQASNSFTSGEAYLSTFTSGNKFYELTDARGNVMAVVTDRKIQHSTDGTTIDYYEPDVAVATDYAPFGSTLPGRNYQPDKYRYGYNGKENDNDVKGEGNQQDYGMRIYDPRLGRFLSVDVLNGSYPWNSPYAFSENDVIRSIDLDGLEKLLVNEIYDKYGRKTTAELSGIRDIDTKAAVELNLVSQKSIRLAEADVYVIRHRQTLDGKIFDEGNGGKLTKQNIASIATAPTVEGDEDPTLPTGTMRQSESTSRGKFYYSPLINNEKNEFFVKQFHQAASHPIEAGSKYFADFVSGSLVNGSTGQSFGLNTTHTTNTIGQSIDGYISDFKNKNGVNVAFVEQITITIANSDNLKQWNDIKQNLGIRYNAKVIINVDVNIEYKNFGKQTSDKTSGTYGSIDYKVSGVRDGNIKRAENGGR